MNKEQWPTCVEKFDLHPVLDEVVLMMQNIVRPANLQEKGYKYLLNFAEETYRANIRALCCMRRIRHKLVLKRTKRNTGSTYTGEHMTATEIREAELEALRLVQQECFSDELKKVKDGKIVRRGNCRNLGLFLDKDGLMRCRSRLPYVLEKDERDAPILVDTKHPFIISYVTNQHVCKNCGTSDFTLNKVRQKYMDQG